LHVHHHHHFLLGARIFGHGLGALAHGVLGQLTRQQQAHARLYFTTRYGRTAIVVRQLGRLVGDALENVIDKRVHDAHGLGRDARVGMHLLQHFVNVDGIRLFAFLVAFLAAVALGARFAHRLAHGFLGSFCWRLWWHSLSSFY